MASAQTTPSSGTSSIEIPEPNNPVTIKGDRVSYRLGSVGGDDRITVNASGLVRTVTVPVPDGYRPVALQGAWQRSSDLSAADLSVEQSGRVRQTTGVSRFETKAENDSLSLDGVTVDDGAATFDLRVQRTGDDADKCETEPIANVSLFDATVVLVGGETRPDSVADYFGPLIKRLTIAVPEPPTPAQAEVAAVVANAAVRTARVAPSQVEVVKLSDLPRAGAPLDRRVEIGQGKEGLHVDGQNLTINGTDDEMKASARLLGTDDAELAQTVDADLSTPPADERRTGSRYSFAELGFSQNALQGFGQLDQTLNLSQPNLGGPIREWTIRVKANYTPISDDGQSGSFSVLLGGTLLRAVDLDKSGVIDETVTFPASLAGRDPLVTFRFDAPQRNDSCTTGTAFTAGVSPDSAVDVSRGQSSIAGFGAWPQSALPMVKLGFDQLDNETLGAAVLALAAAQKVTSTRIDVQTLNSLSDNTTEPLFAVIANGKAPDQLNTPLDGTGARLLDRDGKELVSMRSEDKISSLQAFLRNGDHPTMALVAPTPTDTHKLAFKLADLDNGWFGLGGDVWFTSNDNNPSFVQVRGGSVTVEPIGANAESWFNRFRSTIVIAAIVVAVALLALAYGRVVSSRPGAHSGE